MTALSAADLAELRRLEKEATARPWCIESCGEKGDGSNMIGVAFDPAVDPDCNQPLSGWLPIANKDGEFIEYYRDELIAECGHRTPKSGPNAALIAALRNAAPALLDAAEVVGELVEALEDIARIKAHPDKNVCIATIGAMKERAAGALSRARQRRTT